MQGVARIVLCRGFSSQFRNCSLYTGGVQGIADAVNREDKLIDAKHFRTDGVGKINAVKESKNSGEQTGNG